MVFPLADGQIKLKKKNPVFIILLAALLLIKYSCYRATVQCDGCVCVREREREREGERERKCVCERGI